MPETKIGIHCFISGRVQGVWYRASTEEEAKKLGLTGWARNLPDGRVEVMAFGEKEKLMQLYAWLQRGPKLAKVEAVSCDEIGWQEHAWFGVK